MILGLTGFSGAGKSTVASLFVQHGFHHIDCDQIVHQEVYHDQTVLAAIAQEFGNDVLIDNALNRSVLRDRVMANSAALEQLNQIVMPAILEAIDSHLIQHQNKNIILDAPLLFEYRLEQYCDYTISVVAKEHVALNRIMERDGLSKADAQNRLARQHPASYYSKKSDFVIQNDSDSVNLEHQVQQIINQLYDQTL